MTVIFWPYWRRKEMKTYRLTSNDAGFSQPYVSEWVSEDVLQTSEHLVRRVCGDGGEEMSRKFVVLTKEDVVLEDARQDEGWSEWNLWYLSTHRRLCVEGVYWISQTEREAEGDGRVRYGMWAYWARRRTANTLLPTFAMKLKRTKSTKRANAARLQQSTLLTASRAEQSKSLGRKSNVSYVPCG